MKVTKRYESIRKMVTWNKDNNKVIVRFPAVGGKEIGVKHFSSKQVMDKIAKINSHEIGEVVKKYIHQMIGELIGKHFSTQFREKASCIVDDGIDLTMEKLRMAYAIKNSVNHNIERLHILAGLDFDELGPVYNGRVVRENWLEFTGKTLNNCMPGSKMTDLVKPLTGLSKEEENVLYDMDREAAEEAQAFDSDDKEDRDAELGYIMNQDSDEADSDIPF